MKLLRKNISDITVNELNRIGSFIENNFGLIFHDTNYNKIASNIFETNLSYFIVYHSNEIVAILPLHTIKSGIIKITYSNPTQFELPYGGWVFNKDKISISNLMKITKIKFNEALIYFSNIQINDNNYVELSNFIKKETNIINLSLSEEEIWKTNINSKRRNMIRKALKSDIKIKFYNKEGFELYYPLMKEMYNRVGLKLKSKIFYEKIIDYYFKKNQAVILLAEKDDKVISGVILVGNKNVMHYWQGANNMNTKNYGQGELLQWEAIKWAKKVGSKYYDLCVIERERLPHIARFKLGFSKDIVPFYYFEKRSIGFRVLSKIKKLMY